MSLQGLSKRADRSLAFRLVLIVLMAAAMRLALALARAAYDPSYHSFIIPGNDQSAYIDMAQRLLEGQVRTGPFYFQPGKSLWMLPWLLLSGGSFEFARLVEYTSGALAPLLLFDAMSRLQGRRAGLIAALLAALYPVTAFFESTFLTSSTEALFVTLTLWFSARLLADPKWPYALGAGLAIGMGVLIRMTLLGLLPSVLLALWLAHDAGWGRRIVLGVLAVAAAVITVAPVSYLNTQLAGSFVLSSTAGSYTFYLGNNRDSGGTNEVTQAMVGQHLLGDAYTEAVTRDFLAEPAYMLGLQLRKLGLMMSSFEIPNNFDFYANGIDLAPLLRISPLTFGRVALFALAGLIYTALALTGTRPTLRRPGGRSVWALGIPAAFFLVYWAGTALIWVNSRVRLAIVPAALMLAAAYIDVLLRRDGLWRPKLLALAGSAALSGLLAVAMATLPAPRFLSADHLPEGFIALDHRFDEHLSLRGYRVDQPEVFPRTALYVSLLWHIDAPTEHDYRGFASLTDPAGQPIAAGDIQIGLASHPGTTTSEWPAGTGFREQIILVVPDGYNTPAHGYIRVGLLDPVTGDSLGDSVTLPGPVRIVDRWPTAPASLGQGAGLDFGGLIRLESYAVSQSADAIDLALIWEALADPAEDLHLFVHLVDSAGMLLAQVDGPPLNGALPTSLWRTGDRWDDTLRLVFPADIQPGVYSLRVGLYRYPDGERLPPAPAEGFASQDNAVTLAQIRIEP